MINADRKQLYLEWWSGTQGLHTSQLVLNTHPRNKMDPLSLPTTLTPPEQIATDGLLETPPSTELSPISFSQASGFFTAKSNEISAHTSHSSIRTTATAPDRFTRLQYGPTGPRVIFNWDPDWSKSEPPNAQPGGSSIADPGSVNHIDPQFLADLKASHETASPDSCGVTSSLVESGGSETKSRAHRRWIPHPSFKLISATKSPSRVAPEPFNETAIPTDAQLLSAASMTVISEAGIPIQFGSLWDCQKTIVTFIRHFWCGLDYRPNFDIHLTVFHIGALDAKIIWNLYPRIYRPRR